MKEELMFTHVTTVTGELLHVVGDRHAVLQDLQKALNGLRFYAANIARANMRTKRIDLVVTHINPLTVVSVGEAHTMDLDLTEAVKLMEGAATDFMKDGQSVDVEIG